MAKLFYMGGPLFMGILTLLLLILILITILFLIRIVSGKSVSNNSFTHQLSYLKSLGLFSAITGILGQLIGLMMAFSAIERVGDISPQIVVGGLKVSMITSLYGIGIYLFSIVLWFLLDLYHQHALNNAK